MVVVSRGTKRSRVGRMADVASFLDKLEEREGGRQELLDRLESLKGKGDPPSSSMLSMWKQRGYIPPAWSFALQDWGARDGFDVPRSLFEKAA